MKDSHPRQRLRRNGFTLIELLVVIAIISLLVGVLLPALSAARKSGQSVKCGTNLHHIGQALAAYLVESSVYPLSYIYPNDSEGNWSIEDQPANHPFGYLHWSWFLYQKGRVDDQAFQCPNIDNGGHPATNPGSKPGGWESDQVDQDGNTGPNPSAPQDAQALRMAYTGNAALFPRNKFTGLLSGGPRTNQFVPENRVQNPGGTIMVTEFNKNWRAIAVTEGSGVLSKSHRPVNPFTHLSSGSDEYGAAVDTPGFTYGNGPYYGILSGTQVETAVNLVDNPGLSELNAVGRHHPGNDGYTGGSANFMYTDGHVEKKTILQTIERWEWGNRYYALTGKTQVGPPWNE